MRVSLRRILTAAAGAALLVSAAGCASTKPSSSLTGDYLSARVAAGANAVDAAAAAYGKAHQAAPHDIDLQRDAFFFKLATGDIEAAASDARVLLASGGGEDEGLARMTLAAQAIKAGQLKQARADLVGDMDAPFLKSIAYVADVWIEDGLAGHDAALKKLDAVSGDIFSGFNPLHKALIAEEAGKTDLAKASFQEAVASLGGPVGREAYGAFLERAGNAAAAKDYYETLASQPGPSRRLAGAGLERIEKGEASKAYAHVTPSEGTAIAFYSFAGALIETAADQRQRALEAGFPVGEPSFNLPLALSRLALYLDPGLDEARRLVGTILDIYGDHDGAAKILANIPPSSSLYEQARIEIASSLVARGDAEGGVAALREAVKRDPEGREMRLTLADLYVSQGHREEAVKVLDKLIEDLPEKPEEDAWRFYVARGAALLDLNRWPDAEADLKRAVEIAPDEPTALNYLGYSWAERGENLDEAFKLIERAVAAAPQSGAIIDSLGWAHYQFGDYKSAVDSLEKAAALEPSDPTITDHLGDVYWRLGRKIEARYQWKRALELDPQAKLKDALNKKIANGLPPAETPARK